MSLSQILQMKFTYIQCMTFSLAGSSFTGLRSVDHKSLLGFVGHATRKTNPCALLFSTSTFFLDCPKKEKVVQVYRLDLPPTQESSWSHRDEWEIRIFSNEFSRSRTICLRCMQGLLFHSKHPKMQNGPKHGSHVDAVWEQMMILSFSLGS